MNEIVLPWPSSALSPNARGHRLSEAAAAKKARLDAFFATKASKVAAGTRLHFIFQPPIFRHHDDDNLIGRVKAYRDGIADAWKVNDRSFRVTCEIGPVRKGGLVIVQVSP